MNSPIIRIEIERMHHGFLAMIHEESLKIDEQMKVALDAALQPERIQAILNEHAKIAIDSAIKDEISNFFRSGKGREVIRDAVVKKLDEGI